MEKAKSRDMGLENDGFDYSNYGHAVLGLVLESVYGTDYLGFCLETGTAVVVLSNLSPNDRIPATVLGIKKLQELNQ